MGEERKQIVILGGGFAGLYTALHLERELKRSNDFDVLLVNRENYILFTPMLHEVAASDLDPSHIVNPVHKLLKRVQFFCGDVDKIDTENRNITISHGATHHSHTVHFDHLVITLGSITNFFGSPGVEKNAICMKSLGDAFFLRNQIISMMEEANFECCKDIRQGLLTFVVSGGGFAGCETIGAINDYARSVLPYYPNLRDEDFRIVLIHSGKVLLPELDLKLGKYAQSKLTEKKVEVRTEVKVKQYLDDIVELTDGTKIRSKTPIWTAGTAPHPLLSSISCAKDRGKICVDEFLQSKDKPGIWALGDCALIPDGKGGAYPPTAQHAIREAKTVADNILASIRGKRKKPFKFKTLGQLAALGHHTGVAQIMGFRFSGFIAWWLWRTIYLMKLPRFERKFRVALDWTLDVIFSKDIVQFKTERSR